MSGETRRTGASRRESQSERFERIYRALRQKISFMSYPPGTVLNEAQLAQEFGVSKTPMRSVLQRLSYEGLVTIKNGVGTIVTDLDPQAVIDIYDLRMMLAEAMGNLSPLILTEDTVHQLESLRVRIQKLRGKKQNHLEFGMICNSINDVLLSMISNPVLRELTDVLYYRTARYWFSLNLESDWQELLDAVENEITDYLRSIKIGDMRGIGNARRQYLFMAMERINRYSRAC